MLKRGDILIRYVKYKEIQVLENLIKGYRKLQKENKSIKEANKYWTERYCKVNNESIPKTKAEEMLKELNKKEKEELKGLKGQDRYYVKQMYMYKRSVIEELLEDK